MSTTKTKNTGKNNTPRKSTPGYGVIRGTVDTKEKIRVETVKVTTTEQTIKIGIILFSILYFIDQVIFDLGIFLPVILVCSIFLFRREISIFCDGIIIPLYKLLIAKMVNSSVKLSDKLKDSSEQ